MGKFSTPSPEVVIERTPKVRLLRVVGDVPGLSDYRVESAEGQVRQTRAVVVDVQGQPSLPIDGHLYKRVRLIALLARYDKTGLIGRSSGWIITNLYLPRVSAGYTARFDLAPVNDELLRGQMQEQLFKELKMR